MRIWIDIENPPQVQYLLPLERALTRAGADVVVTARDYGATYDLLRERGVEFHAVGASYGRGRARKAAGLVARTAALMRLFRRIGRPQVSVSAGRAAPVAAYLLGATPVVIEDYEHVDVTVSRLLPCYVLHPSVLERSVLLRKGIEADRLIPFEGIKEDISFWEIDLDAVEPYRFPATADPPPTAVLVRPPAEESHYYRPASGSLTSHVLERLSTREDARVVFSPRYPWQASYLEAFAWHHVPVVIDGSVPFVPLLKGVDIVISSGGTMLREAAYIGTPAYSIFGGKIGGVDRYLESLGRLRLLRSPADFELIELANARRRPPLMLNRDLPLEIAEIVLSLGARERRARGGPIRPAVSARSR